MASFNRFEDSNVWKKVRVLSQEIYEMTRRGNFAKDQDLSGRMRRASVSIMSNIAEGFERNGNREFIHFLSMAKGSAGEIRSQLSIALDQRYISSEIFASTIRSATEISQMLQGLITYLWNSDLRGAKFR